MSDKTLINKIYSAFFDWDFPKDLKFIVIWIVATIIGVYFPILNATPVRVVLSLPIVLFIPGYCFIAALFPKEGDISLSERIALSFGLSVVIVSLIGFGLNFTSGGIRLDPIVISLVEFSLGMILIAFIRRSFLTSEQRYSITFSVISDSVHKEFLPQAESRIERIVSVVITIAIIIAVITTIYVIVFPKEGDRFTEFFILGEKKMAADYPELIIAGQQYPMYFGLVNHEGQNITYTIETWMIRKEFNDTTDSSILERMNLNNRFSLTLTHNETKIIPYNLSISQTGYNRVEFLLFKENIPGFDIVGNDRINASYRDLHLNIYTEDNKT